MSSLDMLVWSRIAVFVVATMVAGGSSLSAQWRGAVTAEAALFTNSSASADVDDLEVALLLDGGFQHTWDRGSQSFAVEFFGRLDPTGRRTRLDFKELSWGIGGPRWDFRLGVRELFWGVTESRHLIDAVNQRDLVVGRDSYVKMGQPMLEIVTRQGWGRLQLLLLPLFRERRFAGRAGQLWSPLPVAPDQTTYASNAGPRHLDAALRWEHAVGAWDFGAAYFRGTNREPVFRAGEDDSGHGVWVPHYEVVDQVSVDVQATVGSWLWKLEGVTLAPADGRYLAMVGGLEYAFQSYLSVFAEYLFDSRGENATTSFGDDLFVGTRLLLQEGQVEGGAVIDRTTGNTSLSLSFVRRLHDSLTVNLSGGVFLGSGDLEPVHARRGQNYVAFFSTFYF